MGLWAFQKLETLVAFGHSDGIWSHWSHVVTLVSDAHIGHRCSHWSQVVTLVTFVTGGHIGHRWSHWSQTGSDFGKRPTSPHTDID